MIYNTMSQATLPRMRELSPAPTIGAYNKRMLFSEQSSYLFVECCLHHIVKIFYVSMTCFGHLQEYALCRLCHCNMRYFPAHHNMATENTHVYFTSKLDLLYINCISNINRAKSNFVYLSLASIVARWGVSCDTNAFVKLWMYSMYAVLYVVSGWCLEHARIWRQHSATR
jgi:hypothetical protein